MIEVFCGECDLKMTLAQSFVQNVENHSIQM